MCPALQGFIDGIGPMASMPRFLSVLGVKVLRSVPLRQMASQVRSPAGMGVLQGATTPLLSSLRSARQACAWTGLLLPPLGHRSCPCLHPTPVFPFLANADGILRQEAVCHR
jgi:hypothetical protein